MIQQMFQLKEKKDEGSGVSTNSFSISLSPTCETSGKLTRIHALICDMGKIRISAIGLF